MRRREEDRSRGEEEVLRTGSGLAACGSERRGSGTRLQREEGEQS